MRVHSAGTVVTNLKRKVLLVGCAGFVLSMSSNTAQANPDGPDVVGGSIAINGLGTSQVDITQSTSRGAINWNSFSIGAGETTRFIQPDSNSITLNRVTGADPSHILGTMTANGKIILINGNGILFGKDAKVDAAGLVVTTHDIDNDAFMSGAPMHFITGAHEIPGASVVNEGQITIHGAGVAAFVAPQVRNSGLIQAGMGKVTLGAGKGFALDFYGDDLISFGVDDNISSTLTAADGTPLRALVENDGLIKAAGGSIVLTAATAREVVNQAVHVTGTVSADSVSNKGGQIILGGASSGIVNVDYAQISAKGKTGGSIKVLGDQVAVTGSSLDASGENGGGTVRVGGGYHGGEDLQRARTVVLDASSTVKADSTVDGDGGSVVLWSDVGTQFDGHISARGEGEGQGGSAEVSSAGVLAYNGTVDLRATSGKTGTLLLDPEDITISTGTTSNIGCSAGACTATGNSSILNVTTLQNALATSNVMVSTGAVGAQSGNIVVANNVTWATGNLLTLSAAANITINSGVTVSNTYAGTFTAGTIPVVLAMRADNAGANNSSNVTNNGTINMSGSTGAVSIYYDSNMTTVAGTQTANGSWAAPADGSISSQFTSYKLVNSVADLTAMSLTGTYALGKNIVGSGIFNSNAPLGAFTGILDGQYGKLIGGSNYSVTGLTLTTAANLANVGLFGSIGAAGQVRNLGLGLAVTASGTSTSTTYNGTLAGINNGTIANVTTTGAIGYTFTGASTTAPITSVGGLVGQNGATGKVINSTASGTVTYTQSGTTTGTATAYVGGLIGQNSSTVATSVSGSTASGTVLGQYGSGTVKTTGNFGGLIGFVNAASAITGSSYTGTSVSSSLQNGITNIGGLIGSNSVAGAAITGASSSGSVGFSGAGSSAANIGGLIGNNVGTVGTSTSTANASYSGTGSGAITVGGLVGTSTGAITTSNATGTAGFTGSGTGGGSVGGLVGSNSSTITNSYATGNSAYASTGASGAGSVGGLVGTNGGTIQGTGILYSYSTGTPSLGASVVSTSAIGGLVGTNSGTIKQAYSTGVTLNITTPISMNAGGLVGISSGTVGDSAASTATTYTNNVVIVNHTPSGSAAPTVNVGDLMGSNGGSVFNAAATGDVTYNYQGTSTGNTKAYVGGLIGQNTSTVTTSVTNASYAGNVLAQYAAGYTASGGVTQAVGGLIGYITGASEIINSVSSGTVGDSLDGKSAAEYLGGLVGYLKSAGATITNSHSSSNITYGGVGGPSVGGLVGYNAGTIQGGSYATGSVSVGSAATTSVYIGGLVGQQIAGASILNSYSDNGTITYTDNLTANIGGLIGQNAGIVGDSTALSATTYSNTNVVMNANPSGSTANTYSLGNLAGVNTGTIVNTKTGGDVTFNYIGTATSGSTTVRIGGLVGSSSTASTTAITNSTSSNTVIAQIDAAATGTKSVNGYVGGLVGITSGANNTLDTVSSSASVTSSLGAGTQYVGGLVGYHSISTNVINNSFATGSVVYNGTGAASIGGLVGYTKGTVKNSYSSNGTITFSGPGAVNLGGLIGRSDGTIGDSAALSATTYSNTALILNASPTATSTSNEGNLVGLMSGATASVINVKTGADVAYNYAGTAGANIAYVGGLIGQNNSTMATSASLAVATNSVTANYTPGFSGAVTLSAGGFSGYVTGITTMTDVSATGNVSSNLAGTLISMGGLVGTTAVATSTITNSFATGNVTYSGVGATAVNVGGLVGKNQGIIQGSGAGNYSYATGDVKVTDASMTTGNTVNLGGLAGTSNATVKQAYSQGGDVQYTGAAATANVGGLVGQMTAGSVGDASAITQTTYTNENVTATVTPTGSAVTTTSVGGLVGSVATVATGSIIYSKATGDVSYIYQGTSSGTGNAYLGGILGSQTNTAATGLSYSYSMGAVSAAYAGGFTGAINVAAGGAVGYVNGLTARQGIWSSSTVTDGLNTGTQYLGGLVGANNSTGATSDSYAVGAVKYTGVSSVAEGGLIGYNKGNVNQSYATGYVMNTGAGVGGLIGNNISGTVTDGYWDTGTTGQVTSAAGTGVTTATMQTALQGSFSTSTWGIVSGETNPYLNWQFATGTPQAISGTAYSDLGVTALGNVSVGAVSNGTLVSSVLTKDGNAVTGANGYYYFLVAPTTLATSNGKVMTYLTGATKANTVIDTANNASGSATGLDLFATYLHEYSASTTTSGMVAGLGTALGGNTGANFLYTFSGGVTTLKTGTNIAVDGTGASLSINQALGSPGGNVYIRNNGAVTQSAAITATKLALGGTGAYTLTNASNAVDTLAGNAASISLKDSNAVTIDTVDGIVGTTTTGATQIVSTGGITLNHSMIAGGTGTSILLAGTGFTNNAGASALTTGAGEFRVWSADPSADTRGGLGYDFKQYNATYGTTTALGTGNGFFYTTAPTLTALLSGITKVYDGNTTASVTGATQNVTGAIDGDTATLSLSGATGTYSDKNAATGKTVTVSGATIDATTNGSAIVYGYQLSQPTSITGEITKASLTISGAIAADKVYDATTTATLGGTAVLSGKVSGDTVNLATGSATGSFADKNVGIAKAVTANGYTISGADAGNYDLAQPTGLTANISQAALTLSGLSASNKVYDATTAATLTGTAALSGKLGGDVVTFGGTGVGTFADKDVANGKAVTVTGYTISGVDAGNYAFVQPIGLTANITPASLTLSGLSASNKVYDALTTATLTGTAALSGKLDSDVVTLGGTGSGTFVDKNVADEKAVTVTGYSIGGADATNYSFVQPTGLTANITPAALTLSGLSALNKVYDVTTTATLSGTAALSGKLGSDVVTIGGTGAGTFGDKNVSNGKTVTVTGYTVGGTDAGNYTFTQPTGLTANITPASLSISGVTASNKVYDALLTATLGGAAILNGKLGSDTVTLGGTAAGAFADKNVGTAKTVTVTGYSVSGADATNYILSQPTGLSANITPASIAVTNISANNKVYDGLTTGTVSGAAALLGKKSGDTVTLSGAGATYNFDDKNVGASKNLNVSGYTISGTDATNYVLSQPTGLVADITPAALSLSGIGVLGKTYDATTVATLSGTASITGKVSGDTVTLSTAGATGSFSDKNAGVGKAITVSGYAIGGADAGNYTLNQPTGLTATITQAALTLSGLSASNKIYDATTAATLTGTAALSGKFGGDTVTIGGTGAATFSDKNVANGKAVAVTGYTISGADAANYAFTQPSGLTANITPAALTLSGLAAANKVYDTNTVATLTGTAALSGKLGSDVVTIGGTGAGTFSDKNVANAKSVTVSGYTIGGMDAGNYAFSQPVGLTANITPAALSVAGLTGVDKVYDAGLGAVLGGTATLSGMLSGDAVILGGAGAGVFANKNVGSNKDIIVTGYSISGTDSGNYVFAQPIGVTANITPASLSIGGITANNKTYDSTLAATLTGTALVQGKMSGDSVTLGGTVSSVFLDKNAGTGKAVAVSGYTITGLDAGNYTLSQPSSLTADITAATLNINGVVVNNKVYDGNTTASLSGTAALQGLFSGDLINLTAGSVSASFNDKNVANGKTVTVNGYNISGTDAGSYNLTQPTGLTANITPAFLTVAGINAVNKVYDSTVAAELNGAAALSGLVSGDNVSLGGTANASFANKNVGTSKVVTVLGYNITGGDAGNYNFTQPTGLSANITPATLGITGVSANDKVYDGTAVATLQVSGTSLTGKYAGDAVTLVTGSVSGAFADKDAGTGKVVLVSGFNITGGDAGNYALLPAGSVVANITPKALSVGGTFTANNKVYDGTADATILLNNLSLSGIIGSDGVTLLPSLAFADPAIGAGKTVSIKGASSLGGASAANYTLLLTGAPTALATIITNAPPVTTAEAQTTTAIISTQPKFAVSAAQFSATPAPVLMSFAPSPAAGSTGSSSGTTASSASGSTKSKDTSDESASSSGFSIISPANASDSAVPEKKTKGECAEGQNGGGKNGAAGC